MDNNCIVKIFLLFLFVYISGTSTQQSKPSETTCGVATGTKSRLDNRIVGGNVSNIEFHPWFAALTKKDGNHLVVACGATLITSTHLITAAHCYDGTGEVGEYRRNHYGILFLLQNRCTGTGKEAKAKVVIVHKKYGRGSELPEYDIAMIVLAEAVSYTPICLPSKASYAQDDKDEENGALIIGYGSTKVRSVSDTYPCELREAKITIYSKQKCLSTGTGENFAKKAICAGKIKGGVDACDGDSGGPLMVKENGKYELIGVTSYGEGCGRQNYPGVYTDLTINGHAKWIQKKLRETSGNGNQPSGQGGVQENGGQTFPAIPLLPPNFPKPTFRPPIFDFMPPLPPHIVHLMNGGFMPPLHHLPPFPHLPPPHFINPMDQFQQDMIDLMA